MQQCIFNGHCTEAVCDRSCPVFAETSYLLERNGIDIKSFVFNIEKKSIDSVQKTLKQCDGPFRVVISDNTNRLAEIATYCSICNHWKGSRLHCEVYNLRFSKYIEDIKKSWSSKKEPEELEYTRIWTNTAKVLIISSLDYMTLGDFESQTLLNLLQSRDHQGMSTLIVSPKLNSLVGKGVFFDRLISLMGKAVIKW